MPNHFLLIAALLLAGCANVSPMTDTPTPPTPTSIPPTTVKTSLDAQNFTPRPGGEIDVGVVIVDILNVREGPGTSFPSIASLHRDEKFYILGETINDTNNKWLLVSLPDNSFGWVIGDRSHVAQHREAVDFDTYSTWQKNVEAGKAIVAEFTADP